MKKSLFITAFTITIFGTSAVFASINEPAQSCRNTVINGEQVCIANEIMKELVKQTIYQV